MPKRWKLALHDRAAVARITREMNCSPLLAQVLASRGLDSGAAARGFLTARIGDLHQPDLMPGLAQAADRIVEAVRCGRRITIYGDYDVDGVTGTGILWHCLKLSQAKVDYYIPCRLEEGYGLNAEALSQLHEEDPRRLLITVDCGIGSCREIQYANELGLEVIVTDHHTIGSELPAATGIVHPRLPGSEYPFGDLCGAGVAFKLAWAVCQRMGDGKRATPQMREFLKSAVGLAAIGTVADVVPLVGENRILVRYGLEILREMPFLGLKALMTIAGFDERPSLTAEDIGFGLAPRINAAGRLGQARLAVELLTTGDPERATNLAEYLDELNKSRQTVERRVYRQAKEMVEAHPEWESDPSLVLAHPEWHPGVIGIVAGRIAERFERPAILIALDEAQGAGQGSARSYGGHDLYAAISACGAHLERFGGHRAAAGLRIRTSAVAEFRAALSASFAGVDAADVEAILSADAEVPLSDLTRRAVRELESLGPFGCEHPRPRLVSTRVELVEPPKRMGGGERHFSARVRQGNRVLRCVAFGKGEWADEMSEVRGPLSICYSAGINAFNGFESVELQLIDWQPESALAGVSE